MSPPASDRAKRLRVLVVDDDPLVRNLLRAVLNDADFDLEEARDGSEALKLVAENAPDVIVLDVMMPGMNGYEVCRTLRADPRLDASRIVILTARDTAADREESKLAGADAFFAKPFSPLDLIESVIGPRTGAA